MTKIKVFSQILLIIITAIIWTSYTPAYSAVFGKIKPILSLKDVNLYKDIFKIQRKGNWKLAKALTKKLNNRILIGYVLSQRFLHPTRYRSKYPELRKWMEKYADHPNATRIYKLALRRKPKNWKSPKQPISLKTLTKNKKHVSLSTNKRQKSAQSAFRSRKSRAFKYRFYKTLRRGHTRTAKTMLRAKGVKAVLNKFELAQLKAKLGHAYFIDGRDQWAINWATSKKEKAYIAPEGHWTAGLANWRMGKLKESSAHFSQATKNLANDKWLNSAAAFWASRAYLAIQKPEKVNHFLKLAFTYPRTFYGMLAGQILGASFPFDWEVSKNSGGFSASLAIKLPIQRTIALLQIGEVYKAERELRKLAPSLNKKSGEQILQIAIRNNLASLAVKLNKQIYPNSNGIDPAAYPIPQWTPTNGFEIDRALIYALIHQESRFNPYAKSWAGARGLMQIMPRTASFVSGNMEFKSSKKSHLFSPETNITLGQRYIKVLLNDPQIKGNLFLLAAAWNGGPGNLRKWLRKTNYLKDPLFFIESIPSQETRHFIERVLTNLWIYRDRLNQKKLSLEKLASGEWPAYISIKEDSKELADNNVPKK